MFDQFVVDHAKPGTLHQRPCVYVLLDSAGVVVNVFREYIDAIAAATDLVTDDPNHTYINNFEFSIYIEGGKGEVCIFVEELM